MENAATATPEETATGQPATGTPEATTTDATAVEADTAAAESLGDAGKRALDAIRAERDEYKQQMRDAHAELETVTAQSAQLQQQLEQRTAALEAQTKRTLDYAIRSAAAGKLIEPSDALAFVDTSALLTDTGEIDTDKIDAAISELLDNRPHLAADSRRKPIGSAGQGEGRDRSAIQQVTRDQLHTMTHAQINEARKQGRLNHLMGAS